MEIIQHKILVWEDIQKIYPDEWVVIGNPAFNGMNLLKGTVLAHHVDKRVASLEGGQRREGFSKFTLIFTGQHHAKHHIGLLRTLPKAK